MCMFDLLGKFPNSINMVKKILLAETTASAATESYIISSIISIAEPNTAVAAATARKTLAEKTFTCTTR